MHHSIFLPSFHHPRGQLAEEEEGLLEELLEEGAGGGATVEVLDAAGKREFDDYGHMRFGKRGSGGDDYQDDYGHLRFGRSYHRHSNPSAAATNLNYHKNFDTNKSNFHHRSFNSLRGAKV